MTCPACGEEERQDRKTVLGKARPLTLHRECLSGNAWHMPLVPQLLDDTEALAEAGFEFNSEQDVWG